MILQAYKLVKDNKGAGGIDEVSLDIFDRDWKNNLYKIWNRMASGTYFPPPVKAVPIPKKSGGTRILGIPTIEDRIAQMVVKLSIEKNIETCFHQDSYGYRPNKSTLDAIEITRNRCWKYNWVLEFDSIGLFDNINHDLLMRTVEKHSKNSWEILYIKRWIVAPIVFQDGRLEERIRGVPQGGAISPLLANLFLHYVFDCWMTQNYANNPWCRYADDAIIHCKSHKQAKFIKDKLNERMQSCGLELHATKTKIVYCKDSNRKEYYENCNFTFLGYEFRPRKAKGKKGVVFTSFLPAISSNAKKSIRQSIKEWRLLWMTNQNLIDIAKRYNSVIQGCLNYYGKYGRKELVKVLEHVNKHLCQWFRRKYKSYKRKKELTRKVMTSIAIREQNMFAHWKVGITKMVG
ncbi:group II intron reverse transcriptase/maturase [Lutibacter sp. B2]|nr:group II intron reverse transcriptase/maturase [Lutibacter sp. B2]